MYAVLVRERTVVTAWENFLYEATVSVFRNIVAVLCMTWALLYLVGFRLLSSKCMRIPPLFLSRTIVWVHGLRTGTTSR